MVDAACPSHLLQLCVRKTEEFVRTLENKHMVWLQEIEAEARKMFSTDFSAEPELMPKTPSQKRRRKKRMSIVPDENLDLNGRRTSRRRISTNWSTSVRRLSTRMQNKKMDTSIEEETEPPKRMTRARVQASVMYPPVPQKPVPEPPSELCQSLEVNISAQDRRSAELHVSEEVPFSTGEPALETAVPPAPVTPDTQGRSAVKVMIADTSTPKRTAEEEVEPVDCTQLSSQSAGKLDKLSLDISDPSRTPTGSRSDRRSVRRSLVGRPSVSRRVSLVNQYSLASKRESMTRDAVRKSMRHSLSKKRAALETSLASRRSCQSAIAFVDEDTIHVRPEPVPSAKAEESPDPQSPRRALRSRGFKKIAISNLQDSEQPQTRVAVDTETLDASDDAQIIRRKSYKRAVDELSDREDSPPRKKTLSPPCPPSKVVKPLPHMKSFLHTVQKNQLLMTPGSIGKNIMLKSFIKRNTPLKTDPKEKERQRLDTLRKKEETELQRKMKIEEGKKQKQEELKLRREERLRKVLQARERVEQLEEEKKKKMEQKFAQFDEKSEKVREDRLAEEKAKKKITAKKQEEMESRRRQEEDARRLKAKQMEEEERRQQEMIQRKRDEEDQERQKKIADAKRLAEQRQAEQERERQREQQLAAEKVQERLQAERERAEKEKALQLQRELERTAQEKEQQRREAEERKREEKRLEQDLEKLRKEQEALRLREEQEIKAKEQQAVPNTPVMNVTVDIQKTPVCESYEMTPKSYKPYAPKIDENYGMDLNSDDSTDDESQPRKPIPPWASGALLTQAMHQQYYNPLDVRRLCGPIENPKLEEMFSKSKPRFFKRTSSAVWHSPPLGSNRLAVTHGLKKY
ncbi:hypothetical protein FKM82_021978 [Ascaphus truei]